MFCPNRSLYCRHERISHTYPGFYCWSNSAISSSVCSLEKPCSRCHSRVIHGCRWSQWATRKSPFFPGATVNSVCPKQWERGYSFRWPTCDISVWQGSMLAGNIRCVSPARPIKTSKIVEITMIFFFIFFLTPHQRIAARHRGRVPWKAPTYLVRSGDHSAWRHSS